MRQMSQPDKLAPLMQALALAMAAFTGAAKSFSAADSPQTAY